MAERSNVTVHFVQCADPTSSILVYRFYPKYLTPNLLWSAFIAEQSNVTVPILQCVDPASCILVYRAYPKYLAPNLLWSAFIAEQSNVTVPILQCVDPASCILVYRAYSYIHLSASLLTCYGLPQWLSHLMWQSLSYSAWTPNLVSWSTGLIHIYPKCLSSNHVKVCLHGWAV